MSSDGPDARGPLSDPRRRTVLVAGAAAPLSAVVLAGCGGAAPSAEQPDAPGPSSGDAPGGDAAALAQVSDVPVGGATFVGSSNTVLSQPVAGDFRAFDATCPHQGCAVSDVQDGQLVCPCHGSRFDLGTGEVLQGPATRGLRTLSVTVDGDGLVLGEGR
jgi:Rieske Fe-S protein